MLIIFDLDDTLIDTFGSITPFRLKKALQKMVHEGLEIQNLSKAQKKLSQINQTAQTSNEALFLFLKQLKNSKKYLALALKEMVSLPFPEDIKVQTTPKAIDTLRDLQKHKLFIVTIGAQKGQYEKLKKAGIDRCLFSNIYACDSKDKKPFYQKILKDEGIDPQRVYVVGDRVYRDLEPAKKLGCITVHMKWGRGLCLKEDKSCVDFEISKLEELKEILSLKETG